MTLTFKYPDDANRFVAGDEWHSLDDGKTWKRGPLPPVVEYEGRRPDCIVIGVNRDTGEITVGTKS